MKIYAALFLSFGLLMQGSPFAAEPTGTTENLQKKAGSYDVATGEVAALGIKNSRKSCNGADCKPVDAVYGCGAFVSHQKSYGFGFAATVAEATSKAMEMCGQNECHIDSAGCQE